MRLDRGRSMKSSSSRTSCQKSSTRLTLVKNLWPPMSKRHLSRCTVRLMPPTMSSASSTVEVTPALASSCAAVRPAGPAPMTTMPPAEGADVGVWGSLTKRILPQRCGRGAPLYRSRRGCLPSGTAVVARRITVAEPPPRRTPRRSGRWDDGGPRAHCYDPRLMRALVDDHVDDGSAPAETGRPTRIPSWITPVAVGAVVAAGVVLRFVQRSPLWLDEALSVNIAGLPVGDLLDALRHDGHPPLYYLLLHYWMELVGDGDMAVRALSGLFAVASLPLVWL